MIIAAVICASIAGSCTSFALSHHLGWNKVLASALPSLSVFLITAALSDMLDPQLGQSVPAAFMGATFCGMSAPPVLNSLRSAAVSGLLFSMLFSYPALYFSGYGGALGTSACIAVLATAALRRFANRFLPS